MISLAYDVCRVQPYTHTHAGATMMDEPTHSPNNPTHPTQIRCFVLVSNESQSQSD